MDRYLWMVSWDTYPEYLHQVSAHHVEYVQCIHMHDTMVSYSVLHVRTLHMCSEPSHTL